MNTSKFTADLYLSNVAALLKTVSPHMVLEGAELLDTARVSGQRVFVIGNGGSAATATHFAADISKNLRVPVKAMSFDNLAALTAYSNDLAYSSCWEFQLALHAEPDDVLVALSTSWQSENILSAVCTARQHGLKIIGLCGNEKAQSEVSTLVDTLIMTPHLLPEVVEDVQSAVCHAMVVLLRRMEK